MNNKFQALLDEYSESHQNVTNKRIHWICVPLIFWSIIALLYSIPNHFLVDIFGDYIISNWAVVALIPVFFYYLSLSSSIAFGMIIFITFCLYTSDFLLHYSPLSLWLIAVIVFALAWIGQFFGHNIEGKKPSFLKDIQFLLIGPAWLLHFIYKANDIKY